MSEEDQNSATSPPSALRKIPPLTAASATVRGAGSVSTPSNCAVSTPTASVSRFGVRSPAAVAPSRLKFGELSSHFSGFFGHFGFQPKKMKPSQPASRLIAAFFTIEAEAWYSSLTLPGQAFFETKPGARAAVFSATSAGGIASSAR